MSQIKDGIIIRNPQASDGLQIHQLIASSPPLDLNSVYSYYLLIKHFSDSCAVAEYQGKVVGFISAYRPPENKFTLFVWQVVVAQTLRGQKVAWHMLNTLLQSSELSDLCHVETTVNPSNTASRRLFERLAIEHGTVLEEEIFLDAAAFGPGGDHESEILLRIPLNKPNS
ncbi:MAG: diaminobutyrate acetyltransferase [Gammaproteobacteria bacterium]|nr:diaminobutyrate acetyltransferase [Gammaproteobacteria bacterium]